MNELEKINEQLMIENEELKEEFAKLWDECNKLKELCDKYEEEHNTVFQEWIKDKEV